MEHSLKYCTVYC